MMLAQAQETLNLREVLDEGKFLLANLGTISAPEVQRLIGALLVNGIFHAAKQRDTRRRRSWFLICDEFGQFVRRDLADSLDQLRKFGVHLVLAHQRLRQLEREDADVLSAVQTNAKIKIVFGGLERPEAARMAQELFTGNVRGDRVKHIATQTKFRPVFDTFDVETESSSETESESDGWGRSDSSGSTSSQTEGESAWDESDATLRVRSRVDGTSSGRSESSSGSRGSSSTRGSSRSVVPITRHEEFEEETGRQFWSIDEEWEHLIGVVHGLPKRHALIKVYNRPVAQIVTPEIDRETTDKGLDRFRTEVLEECCYTKPVNVVVEEIESRRRELAELAEGAEEKKRPFKVKSFRE
jgi:hypothetical protein